MAKIVQKIKSPQYTFILIYDQTIWRIILTENVNKVSLFVFPIFFKQNVFQSTSSFTKHSDIKTWTKTTLYQCQKLLNLTDLEIQAFGSSWGSEETIIEDSGA